MFGIVDSVFNPSAASNSSPKRGLGDIARPGSVRASNLVATNFCCIDCHDGSTAPCSPEVTAYACTKVYVGKEVCKFDNIQSYGDNECGFINNVK